MTPHRTLVLVVADGVRPDVLQQALDAGELPNVAARRARGGMYEVTSSFPSVTGPAYVPFLMGRFPSQVGLPGLRWYDRSRRVSRFPPYARSYAGIDIWHLDGDLHREHPTLLELATPSVAGSSMLGRGARGNRHPGRGFAWMLRAAPSHFRGDLSGWRRVEQQVANEVLRHLARDRPRFATMAFTTTDKLSHAQGPHAPSVRDALRDVDTFVGEVTELAQRGGWSDALHVWVVADHGHAPVSHHDDLADAVRAHGHSVLAHPRVWTRNPDVAVMVGGNAMAHVYLEPHHRIRPWWPQLEDRWRALHNALSERASVDLTAVSLSADTVRVTGSGGASAEIVRHGLNGTSRYSYRRTRGDPLQLGDDLESVDSTVAHDACAATPFPDSLVQLADVVPGARSGDLVLSASPGWDFRERYEPILHVSTHGALRRDQMLVPLVVDTPVERTPRRTADVMPSVLQTLGLSVPDGLDGIGWR